MQYKSKPIQISITFDAQVKICSNGLNVTGVARVRGEHEAASECENTKSSGRGWGKNFHPSLVVLLFCSPGNQLVSYTRQMDLVRIGDQAKFEYDFSYSKVFHS